MRKEFKEYLHDVLLSLSEGMTIGLRESDIPGGCWIYIDRNRKDIPEFQEISNERLDKVESFYKEILSVLHTLDNDGYQFYCYLNKRELYIKDKDYVSTTPDFFDNLLVESVESDMEEILLKFNNDRKTLEEYCEYLTQPFIDDDISIRIHMSGNEEDINNGIFLNDGTVKICIDDNYKFIDDDLLESGTSNMRNYSVLQKHILHMLDTLTIDNKYKFEFNTKKLVFYIYSKKPEILEASVSKNGLEDFVIDNNELRYLNIMQSVKEDLKEIFQTEYLFGGLNFDNNQKSNLTLSPVDIEISVNSSGLPIIVLYLNNKEDKYKIIIDSKSNYNGYDNSDKTSDNLLLVSSDTKKVYFIKPLNDESKGLIKKLVALITEIEHNI